MDATVDSSPLKRLCTFLLGLGTFALFGLLGLIAYKATGGNDDPAYEARASERLAVRTKTVEAQAEKLKAAPVDFATAVGSLSSKKASVSPKPAPGTAAFDEWMAKMAAAAVPPPSDDKTPVDPELVALKIDALPGGLMKFKQTELTVEAGAKVKLTFTNPDVLQHNFLLLKPGTKEKVGALADAMMTDAGAMAKGYIPDSPDVLASTKLVNPASLDVIEFTAPAEPGDYPYICTFPGHWRLMFGTLKVTAAKPKSATTAAPQPETAPAPTPAPPQSELVELKLEALPGGVMKYKQTELTVKAGAKVKLTFLNPDVMQHNFLLLTPGSKDKVGAAADKMLTDPDAMKNQFIPQDAETKAMILAYTKLVNPASAVVLEFTAPSEPGDYPYICTFPGHWRLMFGTLKVTP